MTDLGVDLNDVVMVGFVEEFGKMSQSKQTQLNERDMVIIYENKYC